MRWVNPVRIVNKNDEAADANQQAQTAFYNTLTANYNTDFSQFEGAVNGLQSKLQPIINAGPGQYGFDAQENNALMSSAISNDAASATNAEQAANQQITAANGGSNLVPTGAAEELKQQTDVSSAQKLSSDENTITQAGYAAGQQNYDTALGAEESTLGLMNPNSFAGAASSGGGAATGAVNAATNAAESSDSWMQMVGGALGGVGSVLGGGLAGGKSW
jgi:hypothetical protein